MIYSILFSTRTILNPDDFRPTGFSVGFSVGFNPDDFRPTRTVTGELADSPSRGNRGNGSTVTALIIENGISPFSPISSANLFVLTAWTQTAFSVLTIVFRRKSPFSSSARSQLLVRSRYVILTAYFGPWSRPQFCDWSSISQ